MAIGPLQASERRSIGVLVKMIQRILLARLVCLLAFLLCCAALTQAQQNALGVSPASVEAKVRRGSTYTQTYSIFNNTSQRLRLRCSLTDYWYDINNNRLTGRPGTLPRSASPWVQFTPSELTIEPNSSANVKAMITVPLAANGGYYTMPVFEAMPVRNESSTSQPGGNTATASIGVRFRGLVMLATEDANEYSVETMGGKVLPPTASTPLEMDIEVRNRGNVHARVRGVFAILNAGGALAGRGKVDPDKFLPSQRKTMKLQWAGDLPSGNYRAVVTLSYDRIGMEPMTMVLDLPFAVSPQDQVAQNR